MRRFLLGFVYVQRYERNNARFLGLGRQGTVELLLPQVARVMKNLGKTMKLVSVGAEFFRHRLRYGSIANGLSSFSISKYLYPINSLFSLECIQQYKQLDGYFTHYNPQGSVLSVT